MSTHTEPFGGAVSTAKWTPISNIGGGRSSYSGHGSGSGRVNSSERVGGFLGVAGSDGGRL